MSPNARERAYEKRRYEEWQAKLAERKAARRRARFTALSIAAVAAVVLVIGGTFFLVSQNNQEDTSAAAAPTPGASASVAATAAPTQAPGGCPPSTLPAIASPKQYKLPAKTLAAGKTWTMTMETTCGQIVIELDGAKAPQAVSSTIFLARNGFYDKTPCPRLTGDNALFVLQCGDPTGTTGGSPGYSYGPLENIPPDGAYAPGDVAIARGGTPDSQGSQFFLVYKQTSLPPAQTGGGYTLVGHITKGLDVIEKLAKTGNDGSNSAGGGAPNTPFSIISAKVTAG